MWLKRSKQRSRQIDTDGTRACRGGAWNDSRLVSPTVAADILPRPDQPQHLYLDNGYDYARVETEVKDHGYIPHIRRVGEEKMADGEETQPVRR